MLIFAKYIYNQTTSNPELKVYCGHHSHLCRLFPLSKLVSWSLLMPEGKNVFVCVWLGFWGLDRWSVCVEANLWGEKDKGARPSAVVAVTLTVSHPQRRVSHTHRQWDQCLVSLAYKGVYRPGIYTFLMNLTWSIWLILTSKLFETSVCHNNIIYLRPDSFDKT